MANIKAILDKRSPKKDNTFPVKFYLTHRGKYVMIKLPISVKENEWNSSGDILNPSWIVHHPLSKSYNFEILTGLIKAQSEIKELELLQKINSMTLDELRFHIEGKTRPEKQHEPEKTKYLLTDHFNKYISRLGNERTKGIYLETLNKIIAFRPDLAISEVSISFLKDFDIYLSPTCGLNTRAIHMRNIRAILNDAIDEDIIDLTNYPFRKYKIKKEATRKRALTIDQIKMLRDYKVQEHQEQYRDIFMLIFYLIGINLVDLVHLKPENIVNGRIEYKRAKTGTLYSIEILPEAQAIIDKYGGKEYLLNILDRYNNHRDFTSRINENLKEIGKLEWAENRAKDPKFVKKNVKKITPLFPDLSTYWARFSWASIAAELEIPKETISAALGHNIGSSTTSIYIDFNIKKIDEANRKVLASIR